MHRGRDGEIPEVRAGTINLEIWICGGAVLSAKCPKTADIIEEGFERWGKGELQRRNGNLYQA